MPAPRLPASLGKPVTTRMFSWKEMVIRQWGSEFAAPDHRIYNFSNGRSFDSTDLGQTGIYRRTVLALQGDQFIPGTRQYPEITSDLPPGSSGDVILPP